MIHVPEGAKYQTLKYRYQVPSIHHLCTVVFEVRSPSYTHIYFRDLSNTKAEENCSIFIYVNYKRPIPLTKDKTNVSHPYTLHVCDVYNIIYCIYRAALLKSYEYTQLNKQRNSSATFGDISLQLNLDGIHLQR